MWILSAGLRDAGSGEVREFIPPDVGDRRPLPVEVILFVRHAIRLIPHPAFVLHLLGSAPKDHRAVLGPRRDVAQGFEEQAPGFTASGYAPVDRDISTRPQAEGSAKSEVAFDDVVASGVGAVGLPGSTSRGGRSIWTA